MVAGQDSFPDPEESKILKESDDRLVCGIGLMSALLFHRTLCKGTSLS